LGELLEREIAHAGARVDQHVVVDQKGRGAKATADASAASQHPDLHRLSHGHAGRLATAFRALAAIPMENGLSVHYRQNRTGALGGGAGGEVAMAGAGGGGGAGVGAGLGGEVAVVVAEGAGFASCCIAFRLVCVSPMDFSAAGGGAALAGFLMIMVFSKSAAV